MTSANPVPADPTAVMGRRVGAALIDAVIAIAIMIILFVSMAETASAEDLLLGPGEDATDFCDTFNKLEGSTVCIASGDDAFFLEGSDVTWLIAAPLLYAIANFVVLAGATGASIGKHMTGLRVVKQSDGSLHGFGAAILRWILWIVDGIPGGFFFPLVGLITSLASNGHRRVGDMAASTLVVDKSQVGIPPQVAGLTAGAAAAAPAAPMPAAPMPAPQSAPPTESMPPPQATAQASPPSQPTFAPPVGVPTEPPTAEAPSEPPVADAPSADAPSAEAPSADAGSVGAPDATVGGDQPGIGAPTWDEARNTYIQWDPELTEWMEWDSTSNRWVPISR